MVRNADLITCATQASLNNLKIKYPKYKDKLVYVPNGFDYNEILSVLKTEKANYFDPAKINIVYAGSMSPSRIQIFKKIITVINELIQETKVNQADFQMHFFPGCENLFNFEWISHYPSISNTEEYNRMLKSGDVLISANYNTPYSIPGKLYEFLALSPVVWHFDNSLVCNEVLSLFNISRLYLDSEMDKFKQDFMKLLENKKQFKSMRLTKNDPPSEFVQKFSRLEIAHKYTFFFNDIIMKGVPKNV
jgi:hypothetical protein